MQVLGEKLSFFMIKHEGACRSLEGVPSNVDGKIRYGRGWQFNLNVIRRALRLDVQSIRSMRIISRHIVKANDELANTEFEMKRFDSFDGMQKFAHDGQRKAHERLQLRKQWLTFLQGRIDLLNRDNSVAVASTFDAEAHFEEVWNHDEKRGCQEEAIAMIVGDATHTETLVAPAIETAAPPIETAATILASPPIEMSVLAQDMSVEKVGNARDAEVSQKDRLPSMNDNGELSDKRKAELMHECASVRKVRRP
jgi:hypothetical protein